ncbi:branched-chain amino acid ABC transporter permease [Ideonella margarita]|uniref:Branched-chain amino acid ABC transporter permease n=1 Tax=Ideonella margarita TaxID=2984191 RepID=A0ABU9C920_9BURK
MSTPHLQTQHQDGPSPLDHRLQGARAVALLLALVALPPLANWLGADFYIGLASRILIFALAATSLNLILGFGGMVSFGHAAFVGLGAYTVGVLMTHGVMSAWVAWPAAFGVAALAAWLVGAVSLRTRGVYFIMITLAFAQMLYYLAVSLKTWGGDDGLSLPGRSSLAPLPGLDLANDTTFYYVVLAVCAGAMVLLWRLLNARFGHTLQAIRDNDTRMAAVGFHTRRYQHIAFTLAGGVAGLAGALLANQSGFVSPALMQWQQSGMLMIMVILGGVGHLWGGVIGAVVFLLLEEVLGHYTMHWPFFLGAALLAVVLVASNGLMSLMKRPTWLKASGRTKEAP